MALVSSLAVSPALAQPERRGGGQGGDRVMVRMGGPGMMGGRDTFEPPVNSADLERYAKILALTPDQREAARALLDASMAEFQPAARAAREKMDDIRNEFRETGDPSVWQGMASVMTDLRRARSAAESAFMDDMQMLLSDEQAQKWPVVERTHRRERTLGRGLMSGERVDLTRIVDRMDLPAADLEAIRPVLDQYVLDLDRELIKRNEVYDQGEAQAQNLMSAFQGGDMTAAQEMFNRGREASRRVKEVNQRYTRQLENLLSDGSRQAFSDAVRRESYPMIYRETYATRVLSTALGLDDLDETQRSSLAALRDSHARELASINAQLQAETDERENSADMMQMFGGRFGGGADELRTSRRELENRTVQRARDLLSEAQREKLPSRGDFADEMGGPAQFQVIEAPRRRGGDGEGEGQRRERRRGPGTPPEPR